MDDSDDNLSEEDEEDYNATLQRIKEDDPDTTELDLDGDQHHTQNFTDEEWEELGRDVSNNT